MKPKVTGFELSMLFAFQNGFDDIGRETGDPHHFGDVGAIEPFPLGARGDVDRAFGEHVPPFARLDDESHHGGISFTLLSARTITPHQPNCAASSVSRKIDTNRERIALLPVGGQVQKHPQVLYGHVHLEPPIEHPDLADQLAKRSATPAAQLDSKGLTMLDHPAQQAGEHIER
jgi:hypothetical protein